MTGFTALSLPHRSFLAGVLFLSSASLLALVLYGVLSRSRPWKIALNGAVFLCVTGLTAYVMTAAASPDDHPLPVAWIWLPVFALLLTVYAVWAIVRERKKQKNTLSPSAIKEAFDDLGSGVCFADGNGRIVLINVVMAKLASLLLGSYPQTLPELKTALLADAADRGVIPLGNALYRFPDGKVWRFVFEPMTDMTDERLNGFTQATAQDVTEINETNEEIRRENERIRRAIRETQALMVRLADRVREQETLALKIRIHNDIGTGLLALSQTLGSDRMENAGEQLQLLQHAVWHFAGRNDADNPFADVSEQARTLGIALTFDGDLPTSPDFKRIVILAARECVTNCSKHANGKAVTVRIEEQEEGFTVTVTNDGTPPNGPIREGGGLTSLRETVEQAGGEMRVSHAPAFALTLNLPKEGKNK